MTWHIVNWIAGSILALAWFSRIVEAAFGMPRIADIALPEWDRRPETADGEPRVTVIVPARNEEEHIRETLTRLLALDYSNYEIIAVNDRSTDRTGQIMDEVAGGADTLVRVSAVPELHAGADKSVHATRLKVIHLAELPPDGWARRMRCGRPAQQATGDWMLFTDADVLFKPDSLRRAVAYAEAEKADHVVLVSTHDHEESGREDDDRILPGAVCLSDTGPGRWPIRRPAITWEWARSTWCDVRSMRPSARIERCAWKCSTT